MVSVPNPMKKRKCLSGKPDRKLISVSAAAALSSVRPAFADNDVDVSDAMSVVGELIHDVFWAPLLLVCGGWALVSLFMWLKSVISDEPQGQTKHLNHMLMALGAAVALVVVGNNISGFTDLLTGLLQ